MLYDIIVIGAGASGMMAAITAAELNKKVLLLEAGEKPGRKLLATGNGRCNFTHKNISGNDYYTDAPNVLEDVFKEYTSEAVIELFESMGMLSKNLNDYIYPFSETAATVLDILRIRLQENNCDIRTECDVHFIEKKKKYFIVKGDTFTFESKSVIIATGSKAGGFYKGTQNMYGLAKSFGHSCTKLYPALTKCHCKEDFYKALAGVRAKAKIEIYINGDLSKTEYGEIQFTKTGISGIPVFQLSGDIGQALAAKNTVKALLNFLPDYQKDSMDIIEERLQILKNCTVEQFFTGLLHKKLAGLFIKMANLKEQEAVLTYSKKQLARVIDYMYAFSTEISQVEDMNNAQVCRGGIPLAECTERFMSRFQKGLFLCGEILNVDGICGGYNLHFAWASGRICGLEASNYIDNL